MAKSSEVTKMVDLELLWVPTLSEQFDGDMGYIQNRVSLLIPFLAALTAQYLYYNGFNGFRAFQSGSSRPNPPALPT